MNSGLIVKRRYHANGLLKKIHNNAATYYI